MAEIYSNQALERIDVQMKQLKKMIKSCDVDAINHATKVAQIIKSRRITGDLNLWEFRQANLELEKELSKFVNDCTCMRS